MIPKYSKRFQFKVLAYFSLAVAILGIILYFQDPVVYEDILGVLHPLVALQLIILAYFLLFLYLISNTSLLVYKRKSGTKGGVLAGIAFFFGGLVVAADILWVNYPFDINVLLPESLLYYPVMGFMAEAIFHLLPISLFYLVLRTLTRLRKSTILWISLILTAFIEPIFQVLVGDYDLNTRIFTGVLVFLFSVAQLWVFKYYDWVSMYLLRLLYYGIWHIAWGTLRLDILFS